MSEESSRVRWAGDRGELELGTGLMRHFLAIAPDEPVELAAFIQGRVQVAYAHSPEEQVRRLSEVQLRSDFNGAYTLVNGPFNRALLARYAPDCWHRAWNGRVSDADITSLRAAYIDCDPIRPKGISATDDEHRAAQDVCTEMQAWLAKVLGDDSPLGFGYSGNGSFILVALEPRAPSKETTQRIGKFLSLLQRKFGTETVQIDGAVSNPARLMPAPGTWKRKGVGTHERPHRLVSFTCKPTVHRVALEALC
jgi:hypothetical protein